MPSHARRYLHTKPGFTLIELLLTTALIGILGAGGAVSYDFIRSRARDAKRVSDIRTLRNAIETLFEQTGEYPGSPPYGLLLGTPETQTVSDAGFTSLDRQSGILYLQSVPTNPEPGGVPYVYRGFAPDGSACSRRCAHYAVSFSLENATGDLGDGPHLLTDDGVIGKETGDPIDFSFLDDMRALGHLPEPVPETSTLEQFGRPEVRSAVQAILAPIAVLASVAPVLSVIQLLGALLLQPFLLLGRRRRDSWGTVYNFNTKVPIDLATVRLIDAATNRQVATKVTDKDGRYAFNARRGSYRLEVTKVGFVAPAPSAAQLASDGRFADLYHGTLIHVETDGQAVAYDIPVEPKEAPGDDLRQLLTESNKRSLRGSLARLGPVLGAVTLALSPSVPLLLLFLFQVLVFVAFRRLSEPPEARHHGVVHDEKTKDPIPQAVVRVLSLPYHKVLETKLTDAKGRYSFFVGAGKYYLTVTKAGYQKTETNELDFSASDRPVFIASDLPMRPAPGQE